LQIIDLSIVYRYHLRTLFLSRPTDMSYFTQRTNSPKTVILQAVLIIVFATLVAFGVNSARPDGIHLFENWSQKAAERQVGPGLRTVTFDEIREKTGDGSAVIVDARDADFYLLGHIPGALNLPVHNFDQAYPETSQQLPFDEPIIVYCEGFNCEMSDQLAEKLLFAGHSQVLVYTGGIEEWEGKGMPVETGESGKTR